MSRSAPTAFALMLQGTGSDVGKSLLTAGLCRVFTRRGIKVRPFKPQNMSNNAAVTLDGGEIGRAQALQARACGVEPTRHMNPVLLKPQSEVGAQVVVQGGVRGSAKAADYHALKPTLLTAVLDSFAHLEAEADLVLVEGAGSPAEINLRAGDIANMGFALAAQAPVVLVADVERGGVIAALVGTHVVLDPSERALVRGFIINKFRGDPKLFEGATSEIVRRTGWPCLGVVPWFAPAGTLPQEDGMALARPTTERDAPIRIAVLRTPRIANFDDFDPLAAEPDVALSYVEAGQPLPLCDLAILPGSKSTIADLRFLKAQGWDGDIRAHVRRGGRVLGVCAGYQMLGKMVRDPDGVEGPPAEEAGLCLLDVDTVMAGDKRLARVEMTWQDTAVEGYEMHMGRTDGADRPWLEPGSAASFDGLVRGSYLHGLFAADAFRKAFLAELRPERDQGPSYDAGVEETLNALADHLEAHVDLDALWAIAQAQGPRSAER